jgi:uncharacterized YigZ family protein
MRTLPSRARIEIEIKRSRFVAHAARVDTLPDTVSFYEAVADPAATHNCWAWKLDDQYRFNDDGEPASTAGKPILGAIEGKGLDHVMVIVTRYYGGIKLGAGGLVRAYAGAAARCIDQAGPVEIEPELECAIEADFNWTGQVYTALEAGGATKLDEQFEDGGIRVRARVAVNAFDGLRRALRDATRGEARIRKLA